MTTEILKLGPTEVYEFVSNCLALNQVAYIAGPAAIGKSATIKQVAEDANAELIDLRLSQVLSEDLTGLPERDEKTGKAVYLPFETFPLEGDEIPEGRDGWIIFLDELSSATEEVWAASYSLILDRTVGGKKLHEKCRIVAAGNRASDSAIARELPDTLITRMVVAEMQINHAAWVSWARSQGNKGHSFTIEFIEKNPTMLYAPTDKDKRAELETYPTPRGWEKVFAQMLLHERNTAKQVRQPKVDAAGVPIPVNEADVNIQPMTEAIFTLVAGSVGSLAARSLREDYDESIQLPYPWEIAQSPMSQRLPGNHVGKARLTLDLAKFFLESDTPSRDNVLRYMNRIGGEYAVMMSKEIESKLGQTPSDRKLIGEINNRLNIDELLGTAPTPQEIKKGGAGSDSQIPF